jgi:hypothetical protein
MKCHTSAVIVAFVFIALAHGAGQIAPSPGRRVEPPRSVRLYVFDCGILEHMDPGRANIAVACRVQSCCDFLAAQRGSGAVA